MIFAELVPESKILRAARDFRSILIVACPICANLSIAYERNLPAYEKRLDGATGESTLLPIAIISVANCLKTLLEGRGMKARVAMHGAPCFLADDGELANLLSDGVTSPELANLRDEWDAILSLSCTVGTLGLKKRLGESAKVIPAMKSTGIGQFNVLFDETKTFAHVDMESSTIIPMMTRQSATR